MSQAPNFNNIENLNNYPKFQTTNQCDLVVQKNTTQSRWEVVKAAGYIALAVGASIAMIALAVIIAKFIALNVIGAALSSAEFGWYSYTLTAAAGVKKLALLANITQIAGGALAGFGATKLWSFCADKAKTHWNRSEALQEQAKVAEQQKILLQNS